MRGGIRAVEGRKEGDRRKDEEEGVWAKARTLKLQRLRNLRDCTQNDPVGSRVEVLGNEVSEHGRERGQKLGGLHYGGATSGDGAEEGLESENEGVVPGST